MPDGSDAAASPLPPFSAEFRRRRAALLAAIGFAYASYYMCRYNWSVAYKAVGDSLGFTNTQLGWISGAFFWSYALGQLINGPIIDRVGGRRAMVLGALGTVCMNLALAAGARVPVLPYFLCIWGLNGYLQAFGASSLVKVNANWMRKRERGKF